MKRLLAVAVLALAAACGPRGGGGATGASSSDAAVKQFLFAANAEDLQAMSAVWGDQQSPVRDRVSRQELERRLLIIICHLRHDESRIGPAQAGEAGQVTHRVDLTKGNQSAAPMFTTVRNLRDGRWYVLDLDIKAVQPLCAGSVPAPGQPRPPDASAAATLLVD